MKATSAKTNYSEAEAMFDYLIAGCGIIIVLYAALGLIEGVTL